MTNRTSANLTTFSPSSLTRRLRQFVSSNSRTIIFAVGLMVGVNFSRIIDVASFALYSLSGKAAPGERLALQQPPERTRGADHRAPAAAEKKAREGQVENAEMETERARQAPVTKREAILNAWEAFLAARKGKFNENAVITGDYGCLRFKVKEVSGTTLDLSDSERRVIEQNAKFAESKILDEVADAFIIWLNNVKTVGKSDWTYSDLKDRTFGSIYFTQLFKELSHCLTPQDVWRADRFEKRVD